MKIQVGPNLRACLLGFVVALGLVTGPLFGEESPPEWWQKLPTQPAADEPANLAQAHLLALMALKSLTKVDRELGEKVQEELLKVNHGESQLRDMALSGGARKAPVRRSQIMPMARTFYDVLTEAAPKWLDDPSTGNGQLQLNGTKDPKRPTSHYPWPAVWKDSTASDPTLTTGQLMKVFALRFESLAKHKPFQKPAPPPDLFLMINRSVNQRLQGLSGGESQMALFSIYDHPGECYNRNTELWCADLKDALNGVVVFKGGPGPNMSIADSYGGVMITSRHILFCNHAHPAYPGSPPPWVNGLGYRLRFVTADNVVVERKLIWGQRVEGQDLWIGLIDEDLPSAVKPYRIFPKLDDPKRGGAGAPRPVEIGFSQGSSRLTPAMNHTKFDQLCKTCDTSHYGTRTELEGVMQYTQVPMIYVSDDGGADCDGSKGSELRAPFRYCVWDGDSGTPRFHLLGDELFLSRIILYGGGGGITLGDKADLLNETIAELDLAAVAAAKLKEATGHEVEVITRRELEAQVTEP